MPWLCRCTPEGECGIWKSTSAEANGWRGRRGRCRSWAKVEGLAEQDRGCAEGKAQLHSFITLHLSQSPRGKNDSLSLCISLRRTGSCKSVGIHSRQYAVLRSAASGCAARRVTAGSPACRIAAQRLTPSSGRICCAHCGPSIVRLSSSRFATSEACMRVGERPRTCLEPLSSHDAQRPGDRFSCSQDRRCPKTALATSCPRVQLLCHHYAYHQAQLPVNLVGL